MSQTDSDCHCGEARQYMGKVGDLFGDDIQQRGLVWQSFKAKTQWRTFFNTQWPYPPADMVTTPKPGKKFHEGHKT